MLAFFKKIGNFYLMLINWKTKIKKKEWNGNGTFKNDWGKTWIKFQLRRSVMLFSHSNELCKISQKPAPSIAGLCLAVKKSIALKASLYVLDREGRTGHFNQRSPTFFGSSKFFSTQFFTSSNTLDYSLSKWLWPQRLYNTMKIVWSKSSL